MPKTGEPKKASNEEVKVVLNSASAITRVAA